MWRCCTLLTELNFSAIFLRRLKAQQLGQFVTCVRPQKLLSMGENHVINMNVSFDVLPPCRALAWLMVTEVYSQNVKAVDLL